MTSSLFSISAVNFEVGLSALRIGQSLATALPSFDITLEHHCPPCDELYRAVGDIFIDSEAPQQIEQARSLLVSDNRLIDLRRRLRRGGHCKLGIEPIKADEKTPDGHMVFNSDRRPVSGLKNRSVDMLLGLDPSFLAKIFPAERLTLLEHELRHVLEFQTHPDFYKALYQLRRLQDCFSSPVWSTLSAAVDHYLLRLHAWREGEDDFANRDVSLMLQRGCGAFGALKPTDPWLNVFISALFESTYVYLAMGQPTMAQEATKHVESVFLRRALYRSGSLWLSGKQTKIFQEGKEWGDRLYQIVSALETCGSINTKVFIEKLTVFVKEVEERDFDLFIRPTI